MNGSLTARVLFQEFASRLDLEWVGGPPAAELPAFSPSDMSQRPALAGFLNLIHPNQVQVLGAEELAFLDKQPPEEHRRTVELLIAEKPLIVLVGDGCPMPQSIVDAAHGSGIALLRSPLAAFELVNFLQYHIARSLARETTLHGVFLEVFTIGVHIMGEPGCGKSELALELLTRGHRLIADDAPLFTQIAPDIIEGTCPEALQDCLEVRGLGVLNVRAMFGDAVIKLNKFLRLIIHLDMPGAERGDARRDRLYGDTDQLRVLGLDIPRITLQVRPGRNLAVMVEAAVRDFMLKLKGYDASASFIERHARLLTRTAGNVHDG